MVLELSLVLAIRQTNPKVTEPTAERYAAWVVEEATKRDLDPWLFQALIYKESRWTATALRREGDGSCSVGLGQINTVCEQEKIAPLQDPQANIQKMGEFLFNIRARCHRDCGGLRWLRAYNPGDRGYVATIEEAVKRYHAHHPEEPRVRAVQSEVHDPGLLRVRADRRCGDCWPHARGTCSL